MSLGVGYVDGRAHRLGCISIPKPVFNAEEWMITSTNVTLANSDYDPGTWVGLDNLEACPPVREIC